MTALYIVKLTCELFEFVHTGWLCRKNRNQCNTGSMLVLYSLDLRQFLLRALTKQR